MYESDSVSNIRQIEFEREGLEWIWVGIVQPSSKGLSRGFLVGNFCHSPNTSDYHYTKFILKLQDVLTNMSSGDKEMIILGDLICYQG